MAALSFSENNSAEIVAERLARHSSGKLPKALSSLVDHLHRFIVETRPTSAEWRKAIEFLTEVGHASDQKRQEWVLLSDLLGITALVEEINSRRPKGATPNTVRGPFYRADAPRLPLGANISLDGMGEPLEVSGHVIDLDGKPVTGAVIETWQANAQGFYENQQPDMQPEFNLRGVFTTGAEGAFHYRTIKPSGYAVPCDGPVGQMLGAVGVPLHRPAHLHFIVKAEGFEAIRTHIYDGADPHLSEDALFGVKQELIGAFKPDQSRGARWSLNFTFVMVRARKERQSA